MNAKHKTARRRPESGAAMLIAIFALLLVSVVAIALIVSSGTDTTLAGNYRTSTSAYYAGLAGLEEGRGRLLWRNPDFINKTASTLNFVPIPDGAILSNTQLLYILNPANGETVAPWDTSNAATYPDLEYQKEFGAAPVPSVPALSSTFASATIPGPLYKWVRITAATEASLGVDVNQDGTLSNSVLYYDPINTAGGAVKPSLVMSPVNQTARQVIEITALAVLPNSTQKLMQYVVTPLALGVYFHSALEMPGTTVAFAGSNSTSFQINGNDGSDGTGPPPIPALSSCAPDPTQNVAAVGVTELSGSTNYSSVVAGIPPPTPPPGAFDFKNNYVGNGIPPASIQDNVYINPTLRSVQSLNQTVQALTQNSDVLISPVNPAPPAVPTATQADLPAQMSASNPMTVVVNGNLTLSGTVKGYGLLLVKGDFTTDASANVTWKGIVMVVGTGNVSLSGSNNFIGNFFIAQTAKPFGNPLTDLGNASFDASAASGLGIYRNSCWVDAALLPTSYKILSFREIPYP